MTFGGDLVSSLCVTSLYPSGVSVTSPELNVYDDPFFGPSRRLQSFGEDLSRVSWLRVFVGMASPTGTYKTLLCY